MMTQKARVELIQKEIATYQLYIDVLPQIMEVIRKFNGKVINKRLDDALDAAFNPEKGKREFYIYTGFNAYRETFYIEVTVYDDYITEARPVSWRNGEAGERVENVIHRINNRNHQFHFPVNTCIQETTSGKQRVIAEGFEAEQEHLVEVLQKEIKDLSDGLETVEQMQAEMAEIKAAMEKFDKKYDFRIREVFNCCYRLQNNNSLNYR